MPGTNTFQVKCEPPSDEEENGSLYSKTFFNDQVSVFVINIYIIGILIFSYLVLNISNIIVNLI